MSQILTQSMEINAPTTLVEVCFTDLVTMHLWLNPLLRCEPNGGSWSTEIGSKSRFMIQIPLLQPTLDCVIVERRPGLLVWEFQGFFQGRDRWEYQPIGGGTYLINRFEFEISNPLVSWGFHTFASAVTKSDMKAQMRRIKKVAEELKNLEDESSTPSK